MAVSGEARKLEGAGGLQHLASVGIVVGAQDGGGGRLGERAAGGFGDGVDGGPEGGVVEVEIVHGSAQLNGGGGSGMELGI